MVDWGKSVDTQESLEDKLGSADLEIESLNQQLYDQAALIAGKPAIFVACLSN